MMNIRNAITGKQNDDRLFQLTGLAGVQMGISSGEGRKTKVVPGVNVALQAGWRLSRHFEIYAEPSAVVHGKGIEDSNSPAHGELKFSIGTKFHF